MEQSTMGALAFGQAKATQEILAEGGTAEKTKELALNVLSFMDGTVKFLNRDEPIACCKGCSYCCHIAVMATAPEVLAIAAQIRDKFTQEERARVMEAIDANIAATEGEGYEERQNMTVAYPLLKDGICTVYEVRPLACARWHSFNVESCRIGYEQPDARTTVRVNASAMAAGIAIQDGYQTALKADRVDHRGLDLVRGLKIALEDPSLLDTWRTRPHAFDTAVFHTVYPGASQNAIDAKKGFDLAYRTITNSPQWHSPHPKQEEING